MIIEFAGLPRTGKSSSLETARDYFSRSGFTVRMAGEGARSCPFDKRHRVEIACWTANQALNSILEASYSRSHDSLILQDRGLFDALAFFQLLYLERLVSVRMLSAFMSYFANPRWTELVDLVILFDASPDTVIERDRAAKLGAGPGVITNTTSLQSLSTAYGLVCEEYERNQGLTGFPRIERLNTTDHDPLETARSVIRLIEGLI